MHAGNGGHVEVELPFPGGGRTTSRRHGQPSRWIGRRTAGDRSRHRPLAVEGPHEQSPHIPNGNGPDHQADGRPRGAQRRQHGLHEPALSRYRGRDSITRDPRPVGMDPRRSGGGEVLHHRKATGPAPRVGSCHVDSRCRPRPSRAGAGRRFAPHYDLGCGRGIPRRGRKSVGGCPHAPSGDRGENCGSGGRNPRILR
jgi:hypothetical protein